MSDMPGAHVPDPPSAEEVEALLVEADRRARTIVCDELAGRRAQEYRAAVADHLTARSRRGTPARTSRQEAPPSAWRDEPSGTDAGDDTAWYVYGIAGAADFDDGAGLDDLVGVEDRAVRPIRADDLAALSSQVPLEGFRSCGDDPELDAGGWLPQAVRAHERVLENLCARATVLPFRFGALYPSRDDVRAVISTRSAELWAELDRLDGAAEWGVKARTTELDADEPEPALAAGPASSGAVDSSGAARTGATGVGGTAWMERRREAAAAREKTRRERGHVAGEIDAAMAGHARESLVRAASRPGEPSAVTFDAVYLVPHAAVDDFHDALAQLSERFAGAGLELEVTGPWPPYHFVRLPADEAALGATPTRPPTQREGTP
jgi:Gas vesicle synthesis protein GvpL/GvpF